ncbi:MAG: competence/damage-inducible protein A [Thermogutta sp.]|nr:competence/damage-inducible protein A [Thermogutta sp.]
MIDRLEGPTCEVISIGDEIVNGRLLDTNSQWISQRLEDLGARVLYHTSVGDDLPAMAAVFRQAIARSDYVVTTGGLGPTADDLTRPALAEAAGLSLVEYPEAVQGMEEFFRRRNREMPEQNRVQAWFPTGSKMIVNPRGTAPGIDLEISRPGRTPCRFLCFPGVPVELYEMWPDAESRLRESGLGREYILHQDVKCFGVGESQVESMLPDLIRRGRDPLVGINASQNTIILRISTRGPDREACQAKVEPVLRTIRECLGNLVFSEDGRDLQDVVADMLAQRGLKLAILESDSGGLVTDWMTQTRQGSSVLSASLVVPAAPLWREELGALGDADEASKAAGELIQRIGMIAPADLVLVSPPVESDDGEIHKLTVGVFTLQPSGMSVRRISFSSHPAYRRITIGKHMLNTLRLWLLETHTQS